MVGQAGGGDWKDRPPMPDPYSFERADVSPESKPWIVIQSLLQLSLIALVWLLAIAPVGLVVLGVAGARRLKAGWRALSSRAGR